MQSSPYSNQPPLRAPLLQPGDPGPLFLERVTTPWAIASLIFGIGFFLLPVLSSIMAVISGHLALSDIRRDPAKFKGTGFAVAGLILGYLQLALAALIVLLIGFTIGNQLRIGG